MTYPGIDGRVADLESGIQWRISAAVFRYRANGELAVLLMRRATGEATCQWCNVPIGPVLNTDGAIRDTVERIVLDKTGLGLQGDHIIEEVGSLRWGSEGEVIIKLNFVIYDESFDLITIRYDEFFEYQWVQEERIGTLAIPVSMQHMIRDGFELHRLGVF
ncbi:hypothetical protein PCG10_006159 [Penicillium crustosum]|uniref:Nudix hydrolase domain-containing protein n=1 Tax=Penicillium crustosum TaxID=36656 RepID=A0A9P5GYV7_PENCR|nr:uncharacterized protein N7487_001509 [Penicillium crustosum]KAF7529828.1 hypothetical protein PCG10_006159 [Penicillium crustosum]KAJ5417959.1 hypothetical protein N7487_001509 [Penicillium crustosum]